jgi:hypothetical protein
VPGIPFACGKLLSAKKPANGDYGPDPDKNGTSEAADRMTRSNGEVTKSQFSRAMEYRHNGG